MDAFETATDPGGHFGSGSHSSSGSHSGSSSHNPTFSAAAGPVYCQPITTVTASASVTVAVHSPAYVPFPSSCGRPRPDPSHPTPPFQDPHVPFENRCSTSDCQQEAMELQDIECNTQSDSDRRRPVS